MVIIAERELEQRCPPDPRRALARMASRCGRAAAARNVGRRAVGSGLQIFSDFPARIVPGPPPEDEPDRSGSILEFSSPIRRSPLRPVSGNPSRRAGGGTCRITPLPSRVRSRVPIGVPSPRSRSMPSAPQSSSALAGLAWHVLEHERCSRLSAPKLRSDSVPRAKLSASISRPAKITARSHRL